MGLDSAQPTRGTSTIRTRQKAAKLERREIPEFVRRVAREERTPGRGIRVLPID